MSELGDVDRCDASLAVHAVGPERDLPAEPGPRAHPDGRQRYSREPRRDLLARRHDDGAGREVDVSLARTAAWLLAAPGRRATPPAAAVPGPTTVVTHDGITTARPPFAEYADYPFPARAWGTDPPAW